ncbi:aldo/keto reductase [Candidatus Latescibacterota bacterium]
MKTRREFIRTAAISGTVGTAYATLGTSSFTKAQTANEDKFTRIEFRDLGSTGYKVSEIGMGCMNMRDAELVHAAIDRGINYIDTAHVYMNGQNEEVIGQVMKTKRDKVFLTTKIGLRGKDNIASEIETSLKRLQTDHVDLLLIHHGGDTVEKILDEDYMKVLTRAKEKGQTRFVGYSTHTSDPETFKAAIKCKFYDAILLCYNYESQASLTKSIQDVRAAGIGVIAMKTLLNFNTRPRKPLEDIREDKNGPITYAQALLRWVLSNPSVDTIIPGMTSFEHLAENLAVMGTKLGYEDQLQLLRFSKNERGTRCLHLSGCNGCEGQCPYGVPVHELNRCLGYAYGYGDEQLAWENYQYLPSSNHVEMCADCDECKVKCVKGLNLTENIQKARMLFT